MKVNDLRRAITECLNEAQRRSDAPDKSNIARSYENRVLADRDRVRSFVAFLSGHLQRDDPQLSAALLAFLKAEPGAALPVPYELVAAADNTPPSSS